MSYFLNWLKTHLEMDALKLNELNEVQDALNSARARRMMADAQNSYPPDGISLGTFTTEVAQPKEQEKEKTMISATQNLEVTQRNYLKDRARSVREGKRSELRDQFNLDYVDKIETLADAEAAIKRIRVRKDLFTEEGKAKPNWLYSAKDFLYVEPLKKADLEGYRKAEDLLDKAYVDTKDSILVKPLDQALEALKAFEAKTFQ